jgi:ribosomal-protein-alanine N-acetyltransferase
LDFLEVNLPLKREKQLPKKYIYFHSKLKVRVKGTEFHYWFGADDIPSQQTEKPKIRYFQRNDLEGILTIERLSFPHPWTHNMFKALHQIDPEGFYVAIMNESVVGYGILLTEDLAPRFIRKERAHLMNLAVHPEFHNQKIGTYLLNTMLSNLKRRAQNRIYLEVRASNIKAIAFYEKAGFNKTGIIKNFYGDEDAITMEKKIV